MPRQRFHVMTAASIAVATVALALGLIGCAGTPAPTLAPVAPADIAAMESTLTIADQLALEYTTLPVCPLSAPLCADPATKASIKATGQAAYTAVKTLQASSAAGAPAAYTLAQAAMSAFQATIPPPK